MGQMISIVQVKNKGACAEVGRERGINQSGYAVRSFNRSSARPAPLLRLLAVTETCTASRLLSAKHFGRWQRLFSSVLEEKVFYDG